MSNRRYALLAALALVVIFIASNLIVNSWLRAWRLDLTANSLYSLSQGTRKVLSREELSEPIALTYFFSRRTAAASPDLQAYGARVREMLQAYVGAANGRIRLVEIDPQPFTEEEDQASAAGVTPVTLQQGGDPFYFGLVGANAIDDRRTIQYFDLSREPFLEYEITRLIYELENPAAAKIALISSLPLDPALTQAQFGQPQSAFAAELGRFFEIEALPEDFTAIPQDAGLIAIIQPPLLTASQLYAIDQFILAKGRAFIALDPASMVQAVGAQDPSSPFADAGGGFGSSTRLGPLLRTWGVAVSADVVLDGGPNAPLPVTAQDPQGQPVQLPQPLFFAVTPDRLSRDDTVTAALARGLNFGLAGTISTSERGDKVTFTPLARTTGETMRMTAEQALSRPTPFDVANQWRPIGRIETVALRVSGALDSSFPEGPPAAPPPQPAAAGETPAAAAPARPHLAASATPAQLIIVSDTDFLSDDFYLDRQRGEVFADNGAFALNAMEMLAGSDALASLRARAPSNRPMTRVQSLVQEAQMRVQQQQVALQNELRGAEARLRELRSRSSQGATFFTGELGAALSPQERAEIEQSTRSVLEVRSALRSVGRDLRGDIEGLKAVVVFVNMWLMPLLVAAAGLYFFWRRQRRARRPA
jgi:ABC-type uncharacterized transport system involved in gliding motility auxiliary subunit